MRILAHATKDKKMIQSYKDGKDLYATIASIAFHKSYEECLEFYLDENGNKTEKTNVEGKERRARAKAITLGVCYGKGIPAIAEDLKISIDEAQNVYDSVMKAFPVLQKYMEDSQEMARELGYVDTLWGRKRRLPNMQLPLYEFDFSNYHVKNIDVLDFNNCDNLEVEELEDYYWNKLINCKWYKQKEKIKEEARKEGIIIKENSNKIAEATRQCVNSRIQGSAGDLIKKAMILIGNDKRLKELNCKILLQIHDELLSTCPIENVKECSERLCYLMNYAAKDLVVPFKSDSEVTLKWYGEKLNLEELCN